MTDHCGCRISRLSPRAQQVAERGPADLEPALENIGGVVHMANLTRWLTQRQVGPLVNFLSSPYAPGMSEDERGREFSRLVAVELAAEAKRRGVKQKDLAVAAGITAVHFSHAVNGRKGALTVAVVMLASEHLGVTPQVIVERAYLHLEALTDAEPSTPASNGPGGGIAPTSGTASEYSRPRHDGPPARVRGGARTRGGHK